MAVYNGERYLQSAISSVLDQSFTDFEFIIVDDGSTDRTAEIIERNKDPRIRLISNSSNRGLPASLNSGIEAATGKFVARQDADDVSLRERLELQVAAFLDNDNMAFVGGNWSIIDQDDRMVATRNLPGASDEMRENLVTRNIRCPHGAMMFSRSALASVGGYDLGFTYTQDLELQLKLVAAGHDICSVSEIVYEYRLLPGQNRRKTELQSKFRAIANERYSKNDWSVPVSDSLTQSALETDGATVDADDDLSAYWYLLAVISARAFKPISALRYFVACLKSGDLATTAKLSLKLPWSLLVGSWATTEGRDTH